MQPLAGQDLLHTQPHPMHWLATATAISAVIAVSSLVQPPSATATAASASSVKDAPVAAAAPDPGRVAFPVNCGPNRLDVVRKVSGDLDGAGGIQTVAVVRCHSGAGTPPSGVYVLAQPSDPKAAPRIVATLLAPAQRLSVQDIDLEGRVVSATVQGYSSPDVPRYMPDVHKTVKWQWQGGKFVQSELPADTATEGA
ncbi:MULTISPECIES: hypothetical protein [Streptomyces]|uniref:Lipoprotein n=1 Tax=Streptomyces yunnanensis TaxID=156453 RepID=A0ABY8AEP8_9ACTN|nr:MULTISPECIES: hypothetical protein [Streptomyces]AJC59575.1 hypothetical protein GZL_07019 [Streptomyces sp. 769]WEB43480.1 hypothetical protein MOV08_32200 [Streptomyces yunnanensis]